MNKKSYFLTGMAAIALAIFTLSAAPSTDPLSGTNWLCVLGPRGYSGIALLEFDAAGNATGNFGIYKDLECTYTLDPGEATGLLVETKTLYRWAFTISGNTLTFPGGLAPYGEYNVPQSFSKIEFEDTGIFDDLNDTNWLGWTNRGETLLDNITHNVFDEDGEMDCTTGPYSPMTGLDFRYTYNGSGGAGNVETLGGFTTYDSTATMVFSDFMELGPSATFRLFTYVTAPPPKKASGR
jgi:hypothetical protein